MTVNELKSNISRGIIQNIYLFSGPEIGEKKEVIEQIQSILFQNEEPVVYNFYIDSEFNISDFCDTMQTELLFGLPKIVFLKNIEQANQKVIKTIENLIIPQMIKVETLTKIPISNVNKEKIKIIESMYEVKDQILILKSGLKEADKKKLISALNFLKIRSFRENTYLIMLNETNEKISNSLLNLLTPEQHIIFWEMFDNQKPAWIKQEFKKYELYIEDEAVNFIIDTIENNKSEFENIIQNISIFIKTNNEKNLVDKNLIENFLYHSKEESAFTLYQAILEANLSKSLEILEKLFYTEDELVILNGLVWSHRRFTIALDMYENKNMPEEAIFNELNIKIKKVKDEISIGLKNYNFKHASFMFYSLLELEYYLKTLPEELKIVKFQEFIVKFIYGNSHKSFLQGDILYLLY
ncbi:MAG TPA: hypothetical protein PLE45_12600 [Spirochaetota bacterium]|nr:hypothetical protein [Spirochaetota bacterium]HOL58150.1 hypothetical protein [Spirochaetota bacterium]